MKRMVCEICGSNDIEKKDGVFVCKSCGTQYSAEDAKKLLVEVSGNVEVSGSVKIDNSDRLNNLYANARRNRDAGNYEEAAKYYDYILMDDPNSWEATFFSIYCKALSCKIAEIGAYATLVANSYPNVLRLIKNNVPESQWYSVVKETATLIDALYRTLIKGSYDFYKEYFDFVSIANDGFKCCDAAGACGDAIDSIFKGNQTVVKNAIIPWETCVFLCDGLIDLRPSKVDPYTLTAASRNSYRGKMNIYQNKIEDCKDPDGSIRKRQAEEQERQREKWANEHKASLTGERVRKGYFGAFGYLIAAVLCVLLGRWLVSGDEVGFFTGLFVYFLFFMAFCLGIVFIMQLKDAFKDDEIYQQKVKENKEKGIDIKGAEKEDRKKNQKEKIEHIKQTKIGKKTKIAALVGVLIIGILIFLGSVDASNYTEKLAGYEYSGSTNNYNITYTVNFHSGGTCNFTKRDGLDYTYDKGTYTVKGKKVKLQLKNSNYTLHVNTTYKDSSGSPLGLDAKIDGKDIHFAR